MRPQIVTGPSGCGKTRNATALMNLTGATTLVDEWDGKSRLPDGALALTNIPSDQFSTTAAGCMVFEYAELSGKLSPH